MSRPGRHKTIRLPLSVYEQLAELSREMTAAREKGRGYENVALAEQGTARNLDTVRCCYRAADKRLSGQEETVGVARKGLIGALGVYTGIPAKAGLAAPDSHFPSSIFPGDTAIETPADDSGGESAARR